MQAMVFMEKLKTSAKEWRRQMDVNVTGLAMTAKSAIPYLKASKGRLVLIGSVAAYVPNPMTGAYGASKAAVRSIGQTLAVELKGTGVSCTVIHPGFVDSDITRVDNEGVFHPESQDPRPKNLMWPTDKAAKVMVKAFGSEKIFCFYRTWQDHRFYRTAFSKSRRMVDRKVG
jgi:NAD(P)-dependent dehydrogenase (short-subunit alcohol dehydrogenase family)